MLMRQYRAHTHAHAHLPLFVLFNERTTAGAPTGCTKKILSGGSLDHNYQIPPSAKFVKQSTFRVLDSQQATTHRLRVILEKSMFGTVLVPARPARVLCAQQLAV